MRIYKYIYFKPFNYAYASKQLKYMNIISEQSKTQFK